MGNTSLPTPAHADLDSMLGRKFGKEVANYFSGSPLNRVSFLRTNREFLSTALEHPKASFLLYKDLSPLIDKKGDLVYATKKDIEPLLNHNPFTESEADQIAKFDSTVTTPTLLFLGLDESQRLEALEYGIYKGSAFWALDVTPQGSITAAAEEIVNAMKSRDLKFEKSRMNLSLGPEKAAMFGQGRAIMDWNTRNPFCASCGQRTMGINAGYKRVCPPIDKGMPRESCPTREGLHNIAFPRTDPTVIMAILSADGKRVLVGRQKTWPKYWYSTLAGFCEPAESIEEAVRREVWEESGVVVGRVVIHSTQPWPFPANLMIGAIGQAVPNQETIKLVHDPELEDAKWATLEEVREALQYGVSGLFDGPPPEYKEGNMRLPPETAIANQLLRAVVQGWAGTPEGEAKI